MPRLLAAKCYPALVDVYRSTRTQDPLTKAMTATWDYDSPDTYRCNFMSLKGHSEQFGHEYDSDDAVRLEVSPLDAEHISLAMRFGNLRMRNDETNRYYDFVGDRSPASVEYYFNIDAMTPQVDTNGRIVCVQICGTLSE